MIEGILEHLKCFYYSGKSSKRYILMDILEYGKMVTNHFKMIDFLDNNYNILKNFYQGN